VTDKTLAAQHGPGKLEKKGSGVHSKAAEKPRFAADFDVLF
jgi:hypothetical protein